MKSLIKNDEIQLLVGALIIIISLFLFKFLKKKYYILGLGIDKKDENGKTRLITAIESGDLPFFNSLLENNANVNLTDNKGFSALVYAFILGDLQFINALLKKGADINIVFDNGTLLMLYVEAGHLEVVRSLVKVGASVNQNVEGDYALKLAIIKGHIGITQFLLQVGANPNTTEKSGWTPLFYAVSEGNLEIIDILMDAGADPTICDVQDKTPFDYALEWKKNEISKYFISKGVKMRYLSYAHKEILLEIFNQYDIKNLTKVLKDGYGYPQETFITFLKEKEDWNSLKKFLHEADSLILIRHIFLSLPEKVQKSVKTEYIVKAFETSNSKDQLFAFIDFKEFTFPLTPEIIEGFFREVVAGCHYSLDLLSQNLKKNGFSTKIDYETCTLCEGKGYFGNMEAALEKDCTYSPCTCQHGKKLNISIKEKENLLVKFQI